MWTVQFRITILIEMSKMVTETTYLLGSNVFYGIIYERGTGLNEPVKDLQRLVKLHFMIVQYSTV